MLARGDAEVSPSKKRGKNEIPPVWITGDGTRGTASRNKGGTQAKGRKDIFGVNKQRVRRRSKRQTDVFCHANWVAGGTFYLTF